MQKNEDLLLINGKVMLTKVHGCYTCPKDLWISNGKIKTIGDPGSFQLAADQDARVIDITNKIIMPGFIDAHAHVWKIGQIKTDIVDLRNSGGFQAIGFQLERFIDSHPDKNIIVGRGINEVQLAEGKLPNRDVLDSMVADRPLVIIRTCAHIACLNSKALELLKQYNGSTVDHEDIEQDANGRPTGIVKERIVHWLSSVIYAYSVEDYKRFILVAQQELFSLGITSSTDADIHKSLFEAYWQLNQEGSLKMNVDVMINELDFFKDHSSGHPHFTMPGRTGNLLHQTIKFFADGGLSGETAALNKTYLNGGQGVLRYTHENFLAKAIQAQKMGFRIASHAIGDRAIEQVLSVYSNIDPPFSAHIAHRMEHFGLPSAEAIEKTALLQVDIATQPVFIYELGSNFTKSLSQDYLENVYPVNSLLSAGIQVAFSSDAPVVKNLNPFVGIKAALDRKDMHDKVFAAQEAVNVATALYLFTLSAAKVMGISSTTGSIEEGKDADLIIIDKNPLDIDVDDLPDIRVLSVLAKGEITFQIN